MVEEVNEMPNWKFKSCPKCGGDLFIDSDYNGWYEQCLQCGYLGELNDITNLKKQKAAREKEPAHASSDNREY